MFSVAKRRVRSDLVIIALVFALAMASIHAERLPVRTYTVADGLLRDTVTRIRQDSRGFLWFCTSEGVSRFDGYGFTNFRTDDGLPDRHVNDVLETRDGLYLIATDGGLVRLNPTGIRGSLGTPLFTVYSLPNKNQERINILFQDKDGTVWFGTDKALYRLNARGEPETVSLSSEVNVISLFQDSTGSIWVGTWYKLFRIQPSGKIDVFTTENGLPADAFNALFEDENGRIWLGLRPGQKGGLLRLVEHPEPDHGIVDRLYTDRDGLPVNWVTDIFRSSDGKTWVGTAAGLCLWQGDGTGSVCKTYTSNNDVCDFGINSLTEDTDGNLWVGSACGAKKLARYGFTTYSRSDGFNVPIINSIFENSSGQLYVSTVQNGRYVSRFDGTKFIHQTRDLDKTGGYAGWGWKQTVFQDSRGAWWIPTDAGLFRTPDNTRFEQLGQCRLQKVDTGTGDEEIFRVYEDSHADIWIATAVGKLLRWDRTSNVWHDVTKDAGFSDKLFGTVFTEDSKGNLWIATGSDSGDNVLVRYSDGQFKVFRPADGVPSGWVRDMVLDHNGRLWIANTAVGLLRIDDTTADKLDFVKYTTADGLSSNGAYSVTEDNFGRIYIGTGRGLDRLNPETGQVENFTTADGLPGSEVTVAYRDSSSALWFATDNGLARFVPEPQRTRKPPSVLITGLRTAGTTRAVSILGEKSIKDMHLASGQSDISLDFVGLGATPGEKLHYQYRITGRDWTDTVERTLNFANLSPGSYLFEVRAVSADQLISEPATFSFTLDAPVWERWWFILAISAAAACVIYLVYRSRIRQLLELERVRTRIATDLHDDIGANLTRISILSEVAKQKSGNGNGDLLSSIADIARESVASMNDIVWAVSPEHDSLLDLTRRMRRYAEDVFSTRDIELHFEAPDSESELKLGVGVRRDLLLLFKEAVNNAAKHSGCSEVMISLRAEDSGLILQVSDNGRGFVVDEAEGGEGLRSMSRRAQTVGGQATVDSDPQVGTTVRLVLPFDDNGRV